MTADWTCGTAAVWLPGALMWRRCACSLVQEESWHVRGGVPSYRPITTPHSCPCTTGPLGTLLRSTASQRSLIAPLLFPVYSRTDLSPRRDHSLPADWSRQSGTGQVGILPPSCCSCASHMWYVCSLGMGPALAPFPSSLCFCTCSFGICSCDAWALPTWFGW